MSCGHSIAALVIISSFWGLAASAQNTNSAGPQQEFNYQRWVNAYRQGRLNLTFGHTVWSGERPHNLPTPLATITAVESEDWTKAESYPSIVGPRIVSQQCTITADEHTSSRNGVPGSGVLTTEQSQKAATILAGLPDDHSRLPPPGRRLVVAASGLVRVYDRADLPGVVTELAGMAGCNIPPWGMTFPLSQWWTLEQFVDAGIHLPMYPIAPVFSPDGSVEVLLGTSYVMIVDAKASRLITEIHAPVIAGKSYDFHNPRFTPDGRYLVLSSREPRVLAYDTASWNAVETLPGLPPAARKFFPSSDWSRGITQSADGAIALWAWGGTAETAHLEDHTDLLDAVFSPDDSLVATLTQTESKDWVAGRHFRIWDSGTGKLISDLLPAGIQSDGMFWWPQGKYLLARTPTGIGIWNAESGRYRGEFSGCSGVDRFAIVPDDNQLFAQCTVEAIGKWNAEDAVRRIEDLERSLAESQ